jgi:phospholipase A1/A2
LMFRNNLRIPDNKGAIDLGWAFPLMRSLKGYIQYFNGYGESLLDYNYPVSRVSFGISFSDWL